MYKHVHMLMHTHTPRLKCRTGSLKSSSSRMPLATSVTLTRRSDSSTATWRPSSAAKPSSAASSTAPEPQAAATLVPSGDHARSSSEPAEAACTCIRCGGGSGSGSVQRLEQHQWQWQWPADGVCVSINQCITYSHPHMPGNGPSHVDHTAPGARGRPLPAPLRLAPRRGLKGDTHPGCSHAAAAQRRPRSVPVCGVMQIMQSVLHRLCVVGTCCVCCTYAVCADMHRAAGWQHSAACRALSVCVIITSGPYMLVRQAVMCRHVAQHLEMLYNA